jgi:hypothetical protein
MALLILPQAQELLARILSPVEMLHRGLGMAGFDEGRIARVENPLNQRRFRSWFGSNSNVCAQIWEDLLTTEIEEAGIPLLNANPVCFLMALHFLKVCSAEEHRSGTFGIGERTVRKWSWCFVGKISALKEQKVSFSQSHIRILTTFTNTFTASYHNRLFGLIVGPTIRPTRKRYLQSVSMGCTVV